MKTNSEITVLADNAIPAVFKNAQLTFNAGKNIFLTEGYTSMAGNTYFQGIRFSDRIVITQQIGIGYCYTFLNGIRIFGFNGREATLIAEKKYNTCIYSETFVQSESKKLIKEYLQAQATLQRNSVDSGMLETFSNSLVEQTMKNQLPYQKQLNS